MKKLATTALVCVGLAGYAIAPVSAQAAGPPRWFAEGVLVSEPIPVKTGGTLVFHVSQPSFTSTCKVKDREKIENPASGGPGIDEMTEFLVKGCKSEGEQVPCAKLEVVALGLPWKTRLEEPVPGLIRDLFEGVQLEFKCKKGAVLGTVSGNLNPKVGNSVLEFEGGKMLLGGFGPVTVTGNDRLTGPPGKKKITAA
jgi:hypothetical protein